MDSPDPQNDGAEDPCSELGAEEIRINIGDFIDVNRIRIFPGSLNIGDSFVTRIHPPSDKQKRESGPFDVKFERVPGGWKRIR